MMAAHTEPPVNGEVRHNEPMSKHTSWRVGGPAELFFKPANIDDLSVFLQELDESIPLFWFGLGSNLLVRDGGLRGVVIAAAGIFKDLERLTEHRVRVGASVPCTQLARQCVRWNFGPSEFFAGIPGTVGGALAMNAGAHGGETWDQVSAVTTIDRRGMLHDRSPNEFDVGYRSVVGAPDEWFIEATLQFNPAANAHQDTLRSMLQRRKSTQPLGLPSCGSVFRNPPGDHAARLIEEAGLKGFRLGGAEVSNKHANFIINRDNATASDIERLISHVQQTVYAQSAVQLQHEVRIVGEASL